MKKIICALGNARKNLKNPKKVKILKQSFQEWVRLKLKPFLAGVAFSASTLAGAFMLMSPVEMLNAAVTANVDAMTVSVSSYHMFAAEMMACATVAATLSSLAMVMYFVGRNAYENVVRKEEK